MGKISKIGNLKTRLRCFGARRFRSDRALEAELCGFLETRRALRNRAYRARERYLSKKDCIGWQRRAYQRRDECSGGGKIGRRFMDAHAPRDIEIDIVTAQSHAAMGFQHSQEHRQPAGVPSDNGASWGAERGRSDQRLYFNEQGPCAFNPCEDCGARLSKIALRQEQFGGIVYFAQSRAGHLEYPDLVSGAETILDRPQDSKLV